MKRHRTTAAVAASIAALFNLNSGCSRPVSLESLPVNVLNVRSFPGAEGFGAYAKGGRGGKVVYVTSLADYYPGKDAQIPGTFRYACENAVGPRTIMFSVAGDIELKEYVLMSGENDSYVTIAGQSAPGDGVQLKNHGLFLADGVHDIVIRHLRLRPGWSHQPQPGVVDCITLYGNIAPVRDIIIDHCSLQWGLDECADVSEAVERVTFQWCIFGEGSLPIAGESIVTDGYALLTAGAKGLVSDTFLSLHHNLFATNKTRNPRLHQNGGLADVRYNLMANWGADAGDIAYIYSAPPKVNLVGNYFLRGGACINYNASTPPQPVVLFDASDTSMGSKDVPNSWIHVSGNLGECAPSKWSDPWKIMSEKSSWPPTPPPSAKQRQEPWTVSSEYAVTADTPLVSAGRILSAAGASRPARDAMDARMTTEAAEGAGTLGFANSTKVYPILRGGTAPSDADSDGLPDVWEKARHWNPTVPVEGNRDADRDGYTNLEEYLSTLALDTEPKPLSASASTLSWDEMSECVRGPLLEAARGCEGYDLTGTGLFVDLTDFAVFQAAG